MKLRLLFPKKIQEHRKGGSHMHEKFISHPIPIPHYVDDDEEVLQQHQKSTPKFLLRTHKHRKYPCAMEPVLILYILYNS